MSDPAIEVSGLVVRYGRVTAVDGIDLVAGRGEVVALLGRNGAGKTSTVETLEGYRHRAAGTVTVLGLDPGERRSARGLAPRVGVMLQRGGVYPGMGPAEAVRLFSRFYDDPADPGDLLARLGLGGVARTPWRRLSGGEQQRLSLALALVGRPEVAFLDEPTAGVDPQGRVAIRREIAALRDSGACVLLTTHELEEAERSADRIVIVERGKVVASGTLAELSAGGPGVRFSGPPGMEVADVGAALGAAVREVRPGAYEVLAAGTPDLVAALASWMSGHGFALGELRTGSDRLEDVFLRLTGDPDEPGGER